MPGGHTGDGTAFQIEGARAGGQEQGPLVSGGGDDAIAGHHVPVHWPEQGRGVEDIRPVAEPGRDDNRTGAQRRVQPAGQPEADQPGCATGHQIFGRRRRAGGQATANGNRTEPGSNAPLSGQTDDEAERDQNPQATCGVLARRRLR